MPLAFENIPSDVLVPLFWAEIVPAPSAFQNTLRICLIGEKRESPQGDGATNIPYILSESTAASLFGRGSPLANMYTMARSNAPFAEIWGIAMEPAIGSDFADGEIVITADPDRFRSGLLVYWIGGHRVAITVRPFDTRSQVASRLATAINANANNYVVAVIDPLFPWRVKLLAKWKSNTGNILVVGSDVIGHHPLAGFLTTISPMSGGAGGGDLVGALAAIGDRPFDVIVIPAVGISGSELDVVDTFMDGVSGRWSPIQQLYGHVFSGSVNNTFGNLVTFGLSRTGPHVSLLGLAGAYQPPWEWGAALGAIAAQHWANPPELSRPLQTLEMRGILAPPAMVNRFDIPERQSLLGSGISTYMIDPVDDKVRVERIVTMRRTNAFGDQDLGWRDTVTMFQTMYFVRRMRQAITENFPRAALSDEDTGIRGFTSPGQIFDVCVHEYKTMEELGLVENSELFTQGLVVVRDPVDPNRVNILFRPDLVNQLRVVAALVETNLELTPDQLAFAA